MERSVSKKIHLLARGKWEKQEAMCGQSWTNGITMSLPNEFDRTPVYIVCAKCLNIRSRQ